MSKSVDNGWHARQAAGAIWTAPSIASGPSAAAPVTMLDGLIACSVTAGSEAGPDPRSPASVSRTGAGGRGAVSLVRTEAAAPIAASISAVLPRMMDLSPTCPEGAASEIGLDGAFSAVREFAATGKWLALRVMCVAFGNVARVGSRRGSARWGGATFGTTVRQEQAAVAAFIQGHGINLQIPGTSASRLAMPYSFPS